MRIAIEAATLGLSSGGLARYTAELSLALARCYPDDEFYLVSDQPFRMPPGAPPNLKRGGGPRNALERRWWLWGIARELDRLGADLVHGPDFAVPYIPRRPSVLTLHDLSPWMDPAWHTHARRVAGRTPLLLELGLATMILTPSERVRRQAIERFRLRPERVVAAPEAAPPWLRPVKDTPDTPYFLFVGALEPRKNLPALVEAWRAMRRRYPIDLVLAGRRRDDCPPIPQEPGIRALGETPDEDLARLYSGAVAFVYPSLYEGFGLPVLEAMQCGACVIASRAVAETAGDAAAYADTVEDLTRAMIRAVEDPGWRAARRAQSLARAREFSWERTARITRQVYEEARKRFAG
ncbi:MAG: glycosyltransferase family 1 protein [Bryobacteraceae bacterium]|jgi:glycosyltransferase involved in cell wall biosynthesis